MGCKTRAFRGLTSVTSPGISVPTASGDNIYTAPLSSTFSHIAVLLRLGFLYLSIIGSMVVLGLAEGLGGGLGGVCGGESDGNCDRGDEAGDDDFDGVHNFLFLLMIV